MSKTPSLGTIINWNVYERKIWVDRVHSNELQVIMALGKPLDRREREHFVVDLVIPRFKLAVSQEASRHYRSLPRRLWREKDELKARKCVWYALRDWLYGAQAIANNRITDYAAANHLWDWVKHLEAPTLEALYAQTDVCYEDLKARFYEAAEPPPQWRLWFHPQGWMRWLSIRALALDEGRQIFFLFGTPNETPMAHPLVSLLLFAVADVAATELVHVSFSAFGTDHSKNLHPHGIAFGEGALVTGFDPASIFVAAFPWAGRVLHVVFGYHPVAQFPKWDPFVAPAMPPTVLPSGVCATFSLLSSRTSGSFLPFFEEAPSFLLGGATTKELVLFAVAKRTPERDTGWTPLVPQEMVALARSQDWREPSPMVPLKLTVGAVLNCTLCFDPCRLQGALIACSDESATRVLVLAPHVRQLWEAVQGERSWESAALECLIRRTPPESQELLLLTFPPLAICWTSVRDRYNALLEELEALWAQLGGLQVEQKVFARLLKKFPRFEPILMPRRQRGFEGTMAEFLASMMPVTSGVHMLILGL